MMPTSAEVSRAVWAEELTNLIDAITGDESLPLPSSTGHSPYAPVNLHPSTRAQAEHCTAMLYEKKLTVGRDYTYIDGLYGDNGLHVRVHLNNLPDVVAHTSTVAQWVRDLIAYSPAPVQA